MNEHNKQTWFSASDKPIKNKGYFHTHDSFQDEKCHQNVHIGKRKYSANRNCKYSNLNKKKCVTVWLGVDRATKWADMYCRRKNNR